MTAIYFIRHGQASFGAKNYDQLSDIGISQAELLADYFMDMEAYFPAVYSGSQHRQINTARKIISRLKDNDVETNFNILPEMNEFDVLNLMKYHKDEIIQSDPSFAKDLKQSAMDWRSFQNVFVKLLRHSISEKGDGVKTENFQLFKKRIHAAVNKIRVESSRYKKVAVVTSGGPLAIVMQMIHGLTDLEAINLVWDFYNTSVNICYVEGKKLELVVKNSIVHLKNQGDETLLTYI